MAVNIEMNYKTESGYEVLYPASTIAQIQSLQSNLDSKLNLSGGTMTGNLYLNGNPSSDNQAVNLGYLNNTIQTNTMNKNKWGEWNFSTTLSNANDVYSMPIPFDIEDIPMDANLMLLEYYFSTFNKNGNPSVQVWTMGLHPNDWDGYENYIDSSYIPWYQGKTFSSLFIRNDYRRWQFGAVSSTNKDSGLVTFQRDSGDNMSAVDLGELIRGEMSGNLLWCSFEGSGVATTVTIQGTVSIYLYT